ncbi:MAG TPA: ABC transporter permease [Vicinamibacterales bacterium]|nr:ABC transporter permease [Vicinamibacterales bacterium]
MAWQDLRLRLRALVLRRQTEQELDEELAFHIEREAHKHIAAGMSRDEALALARTRFGSQPRAADECRDVRGTATIDALARDVVYALRTCRRAPLASLTIVTTIALGLALVTVAFTVYNAVFLRADAVRSPEQLFLVERPTRPDLRRRPGFGAWTPFTLHEFEIVRRDTDVLTDAAATTFPVQARINGLATSGVLVSGNFFEMLGASAALGRALVPADDDRAGGAPAIVLSDRGWKKLFQRDRGAIGGRVSVNGFSYDVIGVMAEDFRGLQVSPPDFWAPLSSAAQLDPTSIRDGEVVLPLVIGRLKPGILQEQAEARLTAWASSRDDLRRMRRDRPNVIFLTLDDGTLSPETFKGVILPLAFVFGLILLIACANAANMQFARGLSRQREIGIRLSLGASRRRVVRQLLTESLVLAIAAAALGVVLSRLLLAGTLAGASAAMLPEIAERLDIAPLPLDWRILLFLFGGALVSTMLFGLVPAFRATRIELVRTMKGETSKAAHPGYTRRALVALQVGASALLLVSSAVLLRNASTDAAAGVGLRTSDTLIVPIAHEPLRTALLDQIRRQPGVRSIAASWATLNELLASARAETIVSSQTEPSAARGTPTQVGIAYGFVSPEYFDTLGIDIVQGRAFTAGERSTDAGVVVVSEQGARRIWPDQQAIGQTIRFEAAPPPVPNAPSSARVPSRTYTVVGVARDIGKSSGLTNPDVYVPIALESAGPSVVVRVQSDPDEARRTLLARLVAIDPALSDITTLRAMTQGATFGLWLAFWLTVVLGGLALALTASGLFSVLSYLVEERKKDIGVRMALGATMRNIAGWVLSHMFLPVAVGITVGVGVAAMLLRTVVRWLPLVFSSDVRVFDPWMYAASLAVVVAACVLAAAIPARRAARVDPIETLRRD